MCTHNPCQEPYAIVTASASVRQLIVDPRSTVCSCTWHCAALIRQPSRHNCDCARVQFQFSDDVVKPAHSCLSHCHLRGNELLLRSSHGVHIEVLPSTQPGICPVCQAVSSIHPAASNMGSSASSAEAGNNSQTLPQAAHTCH